MTSPQQPAVGWRDWAPPLSPPADPGLPEETAAAIAGRMAGEDPHCVAAQLWDAYAGMLPAEAPVASVSTGVQSVAYPYGHGGSLGAALSRAEWHRERCGGSVSSLPVRAADAGPAPVPPPGYIWPVEDVGGRR